MGLAPALETGGYKTVIAEPGKTYIGKVRATSRERDALALQLRLASMLSATDLHPPGLPASAIVCIRTMRDPLPGSFSLQRGGIRPPQAWEQAVRASLKQWVQRAAHPISGTVPANAEAVIFEDRAELLACLANDWCDGNSISRWWWQSLFRGEDIQRFLVPAWLDAPEYVPAALQHLAYNGKALRFVQSLRDNDAYTIVQRVTRVFGLHELQSALTRTLAEPRQAGQSQGSSFDSSPLTDVPGSDAAPKVPGLTYHDASTNQHASITLHQLTNQSHVFTSQAAPWQSWVPESASSDLRFEQQCLLGVGLMLLRAPTTVRTTAFARTVLQWRGTAGTSDNWASLARASARGAPTMIREVPDRLMVPTHEEYPLSERNTDSPTIAADPDRNMAVSLGDSSETPLADTLEADTFQRDEHSLLKQDAGAPTITSDEPDRLMAVSPGDSLGTPLAGALASDALLSSAQEQDLAPPAASMPALRLRTPTNKGEALNINSLRGVRIETAFGGIFYLINLGLFLELYGDFTTPLQPGLSLPLWDFLALLAQCLLGEKIQTDPVWELLAQLVDRSEHQAPGHNFEPPDSWRIPAEWLDSFPEENPWQWEVNNGRLRVHHPARFLLLDLPLESDNVLEQLYREIKAIGVNLTSLHPIVRRGEGSGAARGGPLWPPAREEVGDCGGLSYLSSEQASCRKCSGTPSGCQDYISANIPTHVQRWLSWLMPYIYVRLQRALGLTDTDDLPHILCEHHAQVVVTATHLDVTISLSDLPIEIRLAGLDRNPLWVPAAGRFIAFHFESGMVEL